MAYKLKKKRCSAKLITKVCKFKTTNKILICICQAGKICKFQKNKSEHRVEKKSWWAGCE